VGSIPHGSKTALFERFTQAARMPADIAPMTSNGLLDISQALPALAPDWRKK